MVVSQRSVYKVCLVLMHRSGGTGMTESSYTRTNTAVLLVLLALSASTMVWLFWHFPVITAVATVAILSVLGVSARLARSVETDSESEMTELRHEEQNG
jgi:hypothetical protein